VDDEPDIVELLAYNLRAEGYEVITGTDGIQALNLARSRLPDLILLDLMLPELDGFAVSEILHRLPSTADIPVILLTALKGEIARAVGLSTGACEYITKPFSPRDLVKRVNGTLRARDNATRLESDGIEHGPN
jgi:DNA-binding response OmpR family regulator